MGLMHANVPCAQSGPASAKARMKALLPPASASTHTSCLLLQLRRRLLLTTETKHREHLLVPLYVFPPLPLIL